MSFAEFARAGADISDRTEIPHLLKNAREPYERYYDDATREVVQQHYAADFATLGYGK